MRIKSESSQQVIVADLKIKNINSINLLIRQKKEKI